MTRKNLSIVIVLVAAAGLTFGTEVAAAKGPPSPAIDCTALVPGACDVELTALCEATEAAGSLKDRDRDGLVGKVVETTIKISQDKTADAEQKLADYGLKLAGLINATKPKISEADADSLSALLVGAQICVAAIP